MSWPGWARQDNFLPPLEQEVSKTCAVQFVELLVVEVADGSSDLFRLAHVFVATAETGLMRPFIE